jgi:hypothetical protein
VEESFGASARRLPSSLQIAHQSALILALAAADLDVWKTNLMTPAEIAQNILLTLEACEIMN